MSRESGASAGQVEETPDRASLEKLGCRTPPQLHAGGIGRQQQHANDRTALQTLIARVPNYAVVVRLPRPMEGMG